MTARIAGFVSRADAGLRSPKSVSRNISPAGGGVAFHYGGPPSKLNDHAGCAKQWRAWQAFHMDSRGWSDIAYTMGVCQHGYVFAGRGAGVRTAANGTNTGNGSHYAVCWLGGDGETPTRAALDAFEWCVQNLRKAGAGKSVKPHRYFKSTGCPGNQLVVHAKNLDGKDITVDTPGDRWLGVRNPMMTGQDVKNVQNALVKALLLAPEQVDGVYGYDTADAIRAFQYDHGIGERGCGPETWAALRKVVHG